MTIRRGVRGPVGSLLVGVLALAGCGTGTAEVGEPALPVAQAEAVPFEDAGLAPPDAVTDGDEDATATGPVEEAPPEEPDPDASPSPTIGPSSADAAAFLGSDALADLGGLEHVVVDLDGDTWAEVVATGIRDRQGVVRVAWWTVDGYEVLFEAAAGPGRDVTDLRAADVNDDDRTELLVAVEGEGLASLAVWAVPRRGVVEPLVAVGGCHDGTNVYGVTRARLVDLGAAPPAIMADCDDSPLPVADWAEQRWVWEQGAYRVVEQPLPLPVDPADGGDDAGDDGGDDGGDDDDDDDDEADDDD